MPRPDLENRAKLRNMTNEELLRYVNRESDSIHEIADRFEMLLDENAELKKALVVNKAANSEIGNKFDAIRKIVGGGDVQD